MLDKVVTSTELTYTDRLGGEHYTVDGIKAEGDKVVEETRQNLIPLSKQYVDLPSAQADIANIPVNSFTYVRDQSGDALALEYQNVEGTLTPTGRKMPSQQSVDDVYAFIADNDILSPGRNIYNYRTALDGKYLNESGIVTDNPAYILSDYMPVAANSSYATNYNLRFVHCFDANKNLLPHRLIALISVYLWL